MAKKILTALNMAKNELQNARIQNLASAPSSPVAGQVYFDTTLGKFGTYNGSDWDYMGTSEASGDVSSNTSTAVDGEVAVFSGTGGKTIKRATGTGLAKLTSGVLSTATAGTDYAAASHTHEGDDIIPDGSGNIILSAPAGKVEVQADAFNIANDDGSISATIGLDLVTASTSYTLPDGGGTFVTSANGANPDSTGALTITAGQVGALPDTTTLSQLTGDIYYSGTEQIHGLAAPVDDADAATKLYVDDGLAEKADTVHTHTASQVTDFSSAADARIAAAAGSTVASLSGGKVPTSQLPAVSLVTVQTAASQSAMLALTTQEGDVVVRTDENKTYMHNSGSAGTMADFTLLNTPTDAVTSVNGQTGVVSLAKGDVGLGNVDNTADTAKPVSTAQQTALDLKMTKSSNLSDVANAATAFGNIKQDATTSATGVVELATQAEAQAKTDTTRALTAASVADFARKYTGTIGNGSSTSIAVTHGLGSQYVTAQVFDATSNELVECDVTLTNSTTTTFGFTVAPTSNQYRVVIVG